MPQAFKFKPGGATQPAATSQQPSLLGHNDQHEQKNLPRHDAITTVPPSDDKLPIARSQSKDAGEQDVYVGEAKRLVHEERPPPGHEFSDESLDNAWSQDTKRSAEAADVKR